MFDPFNAYSDKAFALGVTGCLPATYILIGTPIPSRYWYFLFQKVIYVKKWDDGIGRVNDKGFGGPSKWIEGARETTHRFNLSPHYYLLELFV